MVDDAHGFGPLGANGAGIVEHFGLTMDDVPVLVGTGQVVRHFRSVRGRQ